MKVTQNILLLTILLLLPAGMTAQTTPSPSGRAGVGFTGFVVFDSNSIFVENNSLSVQNGFTTVLNNTNSVVLTAFNSTPPPPQLAENQRLKSVKTTKKRLVLIVAKTQKAKPESISPTLISWGNSPYGNNSLYTGANNFFALVPSTITNYKLRTCLSADRLRNLSICHFDEGEIAFAYSKTLFQTHETIIITTNYSKTSRIRPPPIS